MYDSSEDTRLHIQTVRTFIGFFLDELSKRSVVHDQSKLLPPEKEAFDIATPKLKELTYGSEEYKAALRELGDALAHHYVNNDHHPEHHLDGVWDMNLFQLVEMFCDWWAASMRHTDGDIRKSITQNEERFDLSPQLRAIFHNTVDAIEPLVKEHITWYHS